MRKYVGSRLTLNHRKFLLLGVLLSLIGFGVITWQASAKASGEEQQKEKTKLETYDFNNPQFLAEQAKTETVQERDKKIIYGRSDKNDTSIPVRDMKPDPYVGKEMNRVANRNPKIPHSHTDVPDQAVQDKDASLIALLAPAIPSPILTFDGIVFPGVGCNCAPPDTVGEVGQTQYVQMVNEGVQVFNKTTGASVFGPVGITTLWNGFGGVCETNGSGDPVVLYDQIANRWVITQFAGSPPTVECIAISTTNDATGSYHRYAFTLGTNFFDYPHLAVWPDAYYMAMNIFNSSGTAFLGPQAFAFDRTKMLAG